MIHMNIPNYYFVYNFNFATQSTRIMWWKLSQNELTFNIVTINGTYCCRCFVFSLFLFIFFSRYFFLPYFYIINMWADAAACGDKVTWVLTILWKEQSIPSGPKVCIKLVLFLSHLFMRNVILIYSLFMDCQSPRPTIHERYSPLPTLSLNF